MGTNEILDLLCEGLEVEPGSLALETAIDDVPEWTSIGWLSIMALVDERLGKQIGAQDIRVCKTVGDLINLLVI